MKILSRNYWDLENMLCCCHHDKFKNWWVIKERYPTCSSNFVGTAVDDIEVLEIKRPYKKSKNNPYKTSQVKPASS